MLRDIPYGRLELQTLQPLRIGGTRSAQGREIPAILEKFDIYRFTDYKEKVIDLLARVTTVRVETVRIAKAMKQAIR